MGLHKKSRAAAAARCFHDTYVMLSAASVTPLSQAGDKFIIDSSAVAMKTKKILCVLKRKLIKKYQKEARLVLANRMSEPEK